MSTSDHRSSNILLFAPNKNEHKFHIIVKDITILVGIKGNIYIFFIFGSIPTFLFRTLRRIPSGVGASPRF